MPEFMPLLTAIIAPLLTLMVLSYIFAGDNPAYRFATYIFIGVAAGYAGAIAYHNVLKPSLIDPLVAAGILGITDPEIIITVLLPLLLVAMLLLKLSPTTARFGTLPLALMVGVGAAVVVGGAITGTLIPQSLASMESLNPTQVSPLTGETGAERLINVIILLIGTITTLLFFRFTVSRSKTGEEERPMTSIAGITVPGPLGALRSVGKGFIAIAFGAVYAGAFAAVIVVLAERVQYLVDVVFALIGSFG
jgi:hypothetical protein